MKINLTTLTANAWAYAAGVHRLATFTVPAGEVAISINNVAGDSGDKTTLSTWYEATPTAGTVTLGADNDLNSDRDWAVIAVSIKPDAAAGNAPPTVSLTSPADGATFTAPATIVLTADAQDSDGTVAQVEFFEGVTLLATITTPPYTFTLNDVQAGSYSFTAKATDDLGASTTSAATNVTVSAPAQLFFIHPDHLNTPRAITNATGQLVWAWANDDPFGNNVPNENPSGLGSFTCNLRLPGQYFDQETNTHYNYFRDYEPGIGRYIQSDPIGLHPNVKLKVVNAQSARKPLVARPDQPTPQFRMYVPALEQYVPVDMRDLLTGINTYAYVDGNPLRYFDARGLQNPGTPSPGSGAQDPNPQCVVVAACVGIAIGGAVGKATGALVFGVLGAGIGVFACPPADQPWPPPARKKPNDDIFGG